MNRRPRTDAVTTAQPSTPRGAAPRTGNKAAAVPRISKPLRFAIFAAVALLVGGAAIGLVVTRLQGPAVTDTDAVQVRASMGGFEPPALTVRAGQAVRIEFSSTDTSMHSDGGGWHQFAIDELGIDWKVGPLSSEVFEFTAPTASGTYRWYCDICCGGKENPSMQGELTVAA